MRRLAVLLLSLALSTTSFAAGLDKSDTRENEPLAKQGRAVIVQPARGLTDADRAELASEGVFIKHALTGGRYLARVKDGVQVDDARVASIRPLTAKDKIHRSALAAVGRGKSWAKLNVIFQRDVDFESARAAILAAGGSMDALKVGFSPSHRILATFPPEALDALAADDRVLTIAGQPTWKVRTDNATSAAVSHVTEVQAAPYGLTGAGVVVSLFELAHGQSDTHPEFGGRATVHAEGGSSGDKLHATHTAGTIGAAGLLPEAKGMAPAVTIHQFCVDSPSNDCNNDWLDDKDNLLAPLGVIADNNSWGYVLGWGSEGGYPVWNDAEEYFGAYDLIVGAPVDEISNTKGILFVNSAGNDGNGAGFSTEYSEHRHVDEDGDTITDKVFCYSRTGTGTDCPTGCTGGCETTPHDPKTPFDTIGVTAGAKNIITVGALSGTTDANVFASNFSSRGPAKDGRVKPDVVARGVNVLSTIPTNSYGRQNGTSMSAPVVTGIAALLTEQWRKTFAGATPTPAQLKALLIAGTKDLGNPGPDYTYGFGLVNAKNSVDAIIGDAGQGNRIRTFPLTQGGTYEVSVVVPQQQTLRVVLDWADPSIPYLGGDDIAAKALVNDLDLTVIDPAGATHLPYVLNKDQYTANATLGVNNTDNTEMLEIPNAAPGVYRVIATGTKITEGPQTAVLVSSVTAAAVCRDPQEVGTSNDTAATAHGNLVSGAGVSGAICTQSDVDFFKFEPTAAGPVSVTITAKDTPLRVTLTGTGVNTSVDVPANSTRTLNANVGTAPLPLVLKIEATGAVGVAPQYSFTPTYATTTQERRHASRH